MKINQIRKQRDGSFLLAIFNLGYGGRGEKFVLLLKKPSLRKYLHIIVIVDPHIHFIEVVSHIQSLV